MAYNPQGEMDPRKIKPKANPMPQAGGAVSKSGPVKPVQPKPKTGGGLQSPTRPRANPMPGQGGGINARSRINELPGLNPMQREQLVRAANRGAGSLRDAVSGQPFEQDVMQAFAAASGAAQNPLGGSRPASAAAPPGADVAVPAAVVPPPIGTQPQSDSANLAASGGGVGPVALPPPGQGQPGQGVPQGLPPGVAGAPAPPSVPPEWDAVNKQLGSVDPATVAQWRQQMQSMPQGSGERLAFLQKMLAGYQSGGGGQKPPVTETPPINPLPPGGPTQTPPIYIPPAQQAPPPPPVGQEQYPEIFNPPIFF